MQSAEIQKLYSELDGKMSPATAHHVHTIPNARLNAAVCKRLIPANPIMWCEKIPSTSEAEHGMALDEDELRTLIEGFRKGFRGQASVFFPIVAVGALTAARRGEVLALRWIDLDVANKTLTIQRALEQTKKHGIRFKEPKTKRGRRTFQIDDGLLALLLAEREKHLRFVAGVSDGAPVYYR